MPTYLVTIAVGLNLILSLTILWTTLCTLNGMSRGTPFLRRLAFILLGTGAFASVLAPLYLQRPPSATELLLVTAVAALRITDMMKLHNGRFSMQADIRAESAKPPYRNPGAATQQKEH